MKRGLSVLVFVCLMFISLVLCSGVVSAVGCGSIITSNTDLTENLTCLGDGLIIDADNIILDCAGHTITGDGGEGDYGIDNHGHDNVTIKNCRIYNFFRGIYWHNADYGSLLNNTINNNNDYGIRFYDSRYNLIYNNFFNNTNNVRDLQFGMNYWNTTYSCIDNSGQNIIGGNCMGGNYWAGLNGYTGEDTYYDGIGDTLTPYNSNDYISIGGDYLPLVAVVCLDDDGDGYDLCGVDAVGNLISLSGCSDLCDCNDNNDSINPGATENCTDGTDKDCDGKIDCYDADCSSHPNCEVDVDSSMTVNFYLPGCGNLPLDTCSLNGEQYCDAEGALYNTMTDLYGCYGGISSLENKNCCPLTYYCDAGSGECIQRLIDCSTYDTQTKCEDYSCYWTGVECLERQFLSCGDYHDQTSCEGDIWGLGISGTGTDVCGTSPVVGKTIPQDSCMCIWDSGVGECKFEYSVMDEIYTDDSGLFKCLKSFTTDDCINGQQLVTWTTAAITAGGTSLGVGDSDRIAAGCSDGSKTRSCGQPIIKLPGFNWINIIAVVFLIALFYLITDKNLKAKEGGD